MFQILNNQVPALALCLIFFSRRVQRCKNETSERDVGLGEWGAKGGKQGEKGGRRSIEISFSTSSLRTYSGPLSRRSYRPARSDSSQPPPRQHVYFFSFFIPKFYLFVDSSAWDFFSGRGRNAWKVGLTFYFSSTLLEIVNFFPQGNLSFASRRAPLMWLDWKDRKGKRS